MSSVDLASRLDPAHRAVLEMLPPDLLDLSDLTAARQRLDGLLGAMPRDPLPADVAIDDVTIPGHAGETGVKCRVYRPEGISAAAPALLWIHGGGMVLGSIDTDDANCARRSLEYQAVVVSVEYRLAPEFPFPAPMNDCYAALGWMASNAESLGIDTARIAVGGASAGGGLAAGLALMARDLGGPNICFQLLVYPMIDHRNVTPSSYALTDTRVWNRDANIAGWAAYLGAGVSNDGASVSNDGAGASNDGASVSNDKVSPYASPSIASDLGGLPDAYINVGSLDMFLDEDIEYALGLHRAGAAVELHVYPGAFHGSNGFVADAPLSIRWRQDEDAALIAALHRRE